MLTSAGELCERFTGQVLIARGFREMWPVPREGAQRHGWRRLARSPVRAIEAVEQMAAEGGATPLPPGDYAVDIDANGDGWVRADAAARRIRIDYRAGLAAGWADMPAALQQGVLRLAAHLYTYRADAGAQAEPPAAVAALWRPWRRLRLV
jgi:uncharacterized phiE125 gp8 family phage protein